MTYINRFKEAEERPAKLKADTEALELFLAIKRVPHPRREAIKRVASANGVSYTTVYKAARKLTP